jgi:ribosomal protein S18 acetylase RimI-like enzyme
MTIIRERPSVPCRSSSRLPFSSSPLPQLRRTQQQIFDRDIQPISALDIRPHLLRLTAADRYLRFGVSMNDEGIWAYVKHADVCGGVTLGYSEQGHVRGIVEVRPSAERLACFELAVSVESDWRGRGCGSCLTRCALLVAAKLRADSVVAIVASTNFDMRAIATKLGATITTHHDGMSVEWLHIRNAGSDARPNGS